MSRKDYIAIAAAIKKSQQHPGFEGDEQDLYIVASNVADALADDNPNFNRERFLAAALGE